MAGFDTQHGQRGGSRIAGYVLATLLGAPLVFVVAVVILRSTGLAIAVSLMAAVLGLTFALRAWSEDRNTHLLD
jgi:hypothetical protein